MQSNDYHTKLSQQVQASTSDIKSHVSTNYEQVERISTQHTKDMTTGFQQIQKLLVQIASNTTTNFQNRGEITAQLNDAIGTLQQSADSGFSTTNTQLEAMQQLLESIKSQRAAKVADDGEDDINNRLQDCIDRLYEINDKRKGHDVYMDSTEAQEVAEDVVQILKVLLDKVTTISSHKSYVNRKMGDIKGEIQLDVQESRSVKRMRGILDSTQSANIRDISQSTY